VCCYHSRINTDWTSFTLVTHLQVSQVFLMIIVLEWHFLAPVLCLRKSTIMRILPHSKWHMIFISQVNQTQDYIWPGSHKLRVTRYAWILVWKKRWGPNQFLGILSVSSVRKVEGKKKYLSCAQKLTVVTHDPGSIYHQWSIRTTSREEGHFWQCGLTCEKLSSNDWLCPCWYHPHSGTHYSSV
jgi:hypothetical protein